MSTTLEVLGQLATISYSTNLTTPSYTALGMISDEGISGQKWTAAAIKSTRLSSTAHAFMPGLPDYGSESFTLRYQKELVATLKGWLDGQTKVLIKILIPDTLATATPAGAGSTAVFTAFITELDAFTDLKTDGLIEQKVTMKIDGAVTFTAGS